MRILPVAPCPEAYAIFAPCRRPREDIIRHKLRLTQLWALGGMLKHVPLATAAVARASLV